MEISTRRTKIVVEMVATRNEKRTTTSRSAPMLPHSHPRIMSVRIGSMAWVTGFSRARVASHGGINCKGNRARGEGDR